MTVNTKPTVASDNNDYNWLALFHKATSEFETTEDSLFLCKNESKTSSRDAVVAALLEDSSQSDAMWLTEEASRPTLFVV